jgi:uncharacterized protein
MSLFLADIMLKKLARWLRIVGVDAAYPAVTDDNSILELAKKENRILLTQDVELSKRAKKKEIPAFLVARETKVEEQVALVLKEFKIPLDFPNNTLCPACGGALAIVGREQVRGNDNVPAGVLARNSKFWLCKCGKAYWEGSHWGEIKKSVEKIKRELAPS